jgi:hypothetical protein
VSGAIRSSTRSWVDGEAGAFVAREDDGTASEPSPTTFKLPASFRCDASATGAFSAPVEVDVGGAVLRRVNLLHTLFIKPEIPLLPLSPEDDIVHQAWYTPDNNASAMNKAKNDGRGGAKFVIRYTKP